MSQNTPKNGSLRRYLLGKLDSETKEQVEESFMTDDSIFQELEIEEDELIQDYVSKNLTAEEEKLFHENFLISDERRENLKLERALLRYAEENKFQGDIDETAVFEEKKPFWIFNKFSSLSLASAAGLVVLAIAAFVVWKGFFQSTATNETLAALNKAYQKERPFESRISGFDYAPANNLRGAEKRELDTVARDDAKSISLGAVRKSPTAENLHSLGQVYLSEKEFDKAVEQLKQAAEFAPQNPEISSDLGTAYLEKGKILLTDKSGKSFELFAQALEQFEKSLVLDPSLQTAQFNKAVCLKALKQNNQAQEAWRNYLELDGKSLWADEARRNLQMLQSENSQSKKKDETLNEFMRAFEQNNRRTAWEVMSRNREMITGKLIPQQLAGLFLNAADESKDKYLAAVKYAGELEKENSKDNYFAEIGSFYSNLPEERIADLKAAQASINKGYYFCQQARYELAAVEFSNARSAFEKSDDEWETRLADYWIAYTDFQLKKIPESTARFESLLKFSEAKKYKWLESIVLSRLAIKSSSTKQFSKSIEYAKKSLKLAEETSDLYLKQKLLAELADEYEFLKRYDETLMYLYQGFELLDYPETSDRQKWRTFSKSIHPLIARKYYATAANIIKESMILNDREIKDETFTHLNYLQLSRVYGKLGNYEEAFKYADQGMKSADNLSDESSRNVGRAVANLNLGKLQSEKGDCQSAVNSYTSAIKFLDSTKYSLYTYDAYKSRLLCYIQLGNDTTIAAEFPVVLKMFEENRTQITEEQNRNNFFDNENDIYDLAVGYEFDNKNYEKAFNYSEESRARSLLDWQKNGAKVSLDESKPEIIFDEKSVQPRSLKEIQSAMPGETQILEYTVLPGKVLIWSITKNNFQYFSKEIPQDELEKKISSFIESIKSNDSEKQNALARNLYDILIAPSKENLDNTKEICLIPDKSLFKLPFAALVSTETDKFLVADYKLLAAPSANVFLASTEIAQKRNQKKLEKILSVGNPEFDRQEFSDLPELPAAKKEAKEIAAFYENPTILLEKEATRKNLQTAISEADVFHFAGHYVAEEQSPLLSGFLLAGTDGKLTSYDLLKGKLHKPKLVVLSACQTGVENYYKGEGMIGAGRTLLASDVPLVVGSLWEVDSDSTAELMEKFHYYRKKENLSTVSALQQAQLEMLNSPDEKFRQPLYWAGFLTVGGHAQF